MNLWKNRERKLMVLALTTALVGNMTDLSALTVSASEKTEAVTTVEGVTNEMCETKSSSQIDGMEVIVYEEEIEMAPVETSALPISLYSLEDGVVYLKNTNEVNWIDRIDTSGAGIIKDFYNTLVEASDNDGVDDFLIEDKYLEAEEGYSIEVVRVTGHEDTEDDVREVCSTKHSNYAKYIRAAFDAFDRDYPEVFWLSGATTCSAGISCAGNVETGYNYTLTINFPLTTSQGFDIRATDYQSESAIKTAIATRDNKVNDLVSAVAGKGTWEKLSYFNQQLTHTNQYNTSSNLNYIGHDCRECISALEGRTGTVGPVCEAYARAFKVLCDEVGIPCVLVDGNAKTSSGSLGEAHMWNYVQVGASWYGVDVTWNDPSGLSSGAVSGGENENWFLVGSETTIQGMTFAYSHPVANQASVNGIGFTNGPTLSGEKCDKSELDACNHVQEKIFYRGDGEYAPTCTNAGLGHKECTNCGVTTESEFVVDALGHTGGTASCKKKAVCSRCQSEYGTVDSSNHGETEIRGQASATCDAVGYTGDTCCKDCGEKITAGTEPPKLGHTGGIATCAKKAVCSRCHQEYGTVNSNNHGETEVRGQVVATCDAVGYTGDTYCKACGIKILNGSQIPALEHSYTSKVTKEPTITTEGEQTYSCSVCGATKKEVISKLSATKGTVFTDQKSKAQYKITKSGKKNGTVEYIKPINKNATVLTIPATVTLGGVTYKVTSVTKSACANFKKLTKVTIGRNVVTLGASAFRGCTKLKTVILGKNVTTINENVFYKCTALTQITIPSKVKTIGKNAFFGCKKLKTITITTTKLTTKTVGKQAFKGIYSKATIKVPKSKYISYVSLLKAKGVSKTAKFKKN